MLCKKVDILGVRISYHFPCKPREGNRKVAAVPRRTGDADWIGGVSGLVLVGLIDLLKHFR